jgi:hypothetical protein
MKRILFALATLALTGCATQRYFVWQNEAGRQCFYQCKRDFFLCRASCPNVFCMIGCENMEITCDQNCPGVTMYVRQ